MSTIKGKQKREYILDKAKELFIKKGYATTSMEDIVQFTGVSKGSIYYHFESKEELFLKLIEKNSTEWITNWKKKEETYKTFLEKIYGVTEHYVSDFNNPMIKASEDFFINHPEQNEVIKNQLLKTAKETRAIYTEIFAEGIKLGALKNSESPEKLAIIFSGLMDGLGTAYYENNEENLNNLYNYAVSYLLHGILIQ